MKNILLLLVGFISLANTISSVFGLEEFEREHMKEYHGIEINDEITFFKLHDLDGDGYWDEGELKYMFGIESDVDPNSSHIQHIIARIYQEIDTNEDKFISLKEYISKKLTSAATNPNDTSDTANKKRSTTTKKSKNDDSTKKKKSSNKKSSSSNKDNPKFIKRNGYEGIPLKFRV